MNQILNQKNSDNESVVNCFCGGGIMCRVGLTVKQSEDESESGKVRGEPTYLGRSNLIDFSDTRAFLDYFLPLIFFFEPVLDGNGFSGESLCLLEAEAPFGDTCAMTPSLVRPKPNSVRIVRNIARKRAKLNKACTNRIAPCAAFDLRDGCW